MGKSSRGSEPAIGIVFSGHELVFRQFEDEAVGIVNLVERFEDTPGVDRHGAVFFW
jgi:hypothetical protein